MLSEAPSARPVGVLIVSQHEWTSRSLASILAPHGYLVLKAFTREQALAHVRRDPPDAIIIDERLPDGDGYSLCKEFYEANMIAPSTPVFLALPRAPTRRDRLATLRAGAWACLGDPLDAEELIAALGAVVPAKLDADNARATGLIDEMTGVYNERGLSRRAEEMAAEASRRHGAIGCVLIAPDIETGEPSLALLRRIAASLRAATRHSDAVGRLGQNAFAVVAVDTDDVQARRLAERLAAAILATPASAASGPYRTLVPQEGAPPQPRLRVRAGYHGVKDFRVASIDSSELMLRATAALQNARTDQPDAWLQQYH
ncbi:MAG TPA: response regulator [Gemmatimonadales bacterium]|jgi:PleD family two-component response regulator